jgi:hypothetical protein
MFLHRNAKLGLERLDVERGYIQHPTLGRDLHIIDLTLSAIVRGDGAY